MFAGLSVYVQLPLASTTTSLELRVTSANLSVIFPPGSPVPIMVLSPFTLLKTSVEPTVPAELTETAGALVSTLNDGVEVKAATPRFPAGSTTDRVEVVALCVASAARSALVPVAVKAVPAVAAVNLNAPSVVPAVATTGLLVVALICVTRSLRTAASVSPEAIVWE